MMSAALKILNLIVGSLGGIIASLLGNKATKAGTREEKLRTLEGNIEAAKRKKEIDHETSQLGDASRRDALGRFVRDDGDSSDE